MSTLKGSAWTGKLYFDENTDEPAAEAGHELNAEQLVQRLNELAVDEKILKVEMWKEPLFHAMPNVSFYPMFHAIFLVQTEEWWWSIEKNSKRLIMQRSRVMADNAERAKNEVLYRRLRQRRCENNGYIEQLKEMTLPSADASLSDFFMVLQDNDELAREYNLFKDNCQYFANRLYEYFENEEYQGKFRDLIEKLRKKVARDLRNFANELRDHNQKDEDGDGDDEA